MDDARLARIRAKVHRFPRAPGVYEWKDRDGRTLYVGKAQDLRARVGSYVTGAQAAKTGEMLRAADDVEYIAVRNNKEALLLEQTLIKRHHPRYNVRLTDGKQYPYLMLTAPPYPRLMKVHRMLDDGGTYFGPFPDGYGAFHVMQVLNDLFPLRRCKTLPTQKCLYYDIGKCIAPCIAACTDDEYDALVADVKDLLRGRSTGLVKRLSAELDAAAAAHEYERAARLRDQLRGLQGVLEKQNMLSARLEDRDIAALAQSGDAAVVVLLHQRGGKIVGQSPYVVAGVQDEADALGAFLVGHYAQRVVPRHVAADLDDAVAEALEADLRELAGHAVTVETPRRGEKLRWLEVAATNAALRLEEEIETAKKRGMGALEALRTTLALDRLPLVIEGFDVSHQAGAHTRAAMVRFVAGRPDKAGYRMFGMRTVGDVRGGVRAVGDVHSGDDASAPRPAARTAPPSRGPGRDVDDFASIEEAVRRRVRGLLERGERLPDLVLIDGGRGQLSAAQSALAAHGVADLPVVALAKQDEELWLPGRQRPLRLERRDAGLQLLQRVRDEAHRFGITQVRRKTSAAVTGSPLDGVKGIGPVRRRELVKAFGGLQGLRAATAEDVARMPGIDRALAERVVAALATDTTA
jgi:excinuclease ABC subunit C